MKDKFLCIDNGGTYIKACLIDAGGKQLKSARIKTGVLHPGPRLTEVNQDDLWRNNCTVIKEILRDTDPNEIACVGFSGMGKGCWMVDEEGNSIRNAITSSDSRAMGYVNQWKTDGTDEKAYPYMYQVASASKPHSILRWLKDNEPDNYHRIRWVFSMKDLLTYKLTGKAQGGVAAMSGTNLLNFNTLQYDKDLFEIYGIEEMYDKMPPLVYDSELAGTVTKKASEETGLPEGTKVSCGMFDVNASAIAMGVTDEEKMLIITGTSGINAFINKKPITNGSIKLNSIYALKGYYFIEEGSNASSGTLEWVLDQFYGKERDADIYKEVNELVASVDVFDSKLIYLPYLSGYRDYRNATACFLGLRPQYGRAHMLRAVYEGVVFSHMTQIEHLLVNREKPDRILMAGGATNSEVWVQMFADALQCDIEMIANEEMGPKGVAITASVACGMYGTIEEAVKIMSVKGTVIKHDPGLKDIYEEKYAAYKKTVDALKDIWGILS